MSELKVGATVWIESDRNEPDEVVITGETKQSWIFGEGWNQQKIDKKRDGFGLYRTRPVSTQHPNIRRVFTSREEIDQQRWVERNRYYIGSCVHVCDNHALLRQIADLVGYKEPPCK